MFLFLLCIRALFLFLITSPDFNKVVRRKLIHCQAQSRANRILTACLKKEGEHSREETMSARNSGFNALFNLSCYLKENNLAVVYSAKEEGTATKINLVTNPSLSASFLSSHNNDDHNYLSSIFPLHYYYI